MRLPMQAQDLRADQDIVREGDRPSRSCLLIEGFACRYSVTGAGKRQIMSFHIPGEIPDIQSLHLKTMDHSLATITPCKVGFIQHEVLQDLCNRYPPPCGCVLARDADRRGHLPGVDDRDRQTPSGWADRSPYLRNADPMGAVGLAEGNTCLWPLTQAELGDALGLTTVHVNRVLQGLRAAGLITITKRHLIVDDWERLKALGEFNSTYLHQVPREPA